MLRLFIALDLLIETKQKLEKLATSLNIPEARTIAAKNIHATLKFLGYTEPNLLQPVESKLKAIAGRHRPFEISFEYLGAFPYPKRSRVLWVGSDDNQQIVKLAADIDQAMRLLDFEAEKRAYKLHLTLSRFKKAVDLRTFISKPFPTIVEKIDSFALFESKLSPKGAQYKVLKKFFLKKA